MSDEENFTMIEILQTIIFSFFNLQVKHFMKQRDWVKFKKEFYNKPQSE